MCQALFYLIVFSHLRFYLPTGLTLIASQTLIYLWMIFNWHIHLLCECNSRALWWRKLQRLLVTILEQHRPHFDDFCKQDKIWSLWQYKQTGNSMRRQGIFIWVTISKIHDITPNVLKCEKFVSCNKNVKWNILQSVQICFRCSYCLLFKQRKPRMRSAFEKTIKGLSKYTKCVWMKLFG